MDATIRIFVEAQNEAKARLVVDAVVGALGRGVCAGPIEPYHKGGSVCDLRIAAELPTLAESVLALLSRTQRVGRMWQLSGAIEEELDAWSTECSVPGVRAMHLQSRRPPR